MGSDRHDGWSIGSHRPIWLSGRVLVLSEGRPTTGVVEACLNSRVSVRQAGNVLLSQPAMSKSLDTNCNEVESTTSFNSRSGHV